MRNVVLAVVSLFSFALHAQVYNPVKWKFDYKLDGDEHAILQFTATIEKGWHVYSTTVAPDVGPIPTSFDFQSLKGAALVGTIREPKPHVEFDPNFRMELAWFDGTATFEQKIKLTETMAQVKGELTFMTCDDSKCLPPEYIEFNFNVEAAVKPSSKPMESSEAKGPAEPVSEAPTEVEPQEAVSNDSEIHSPVRWKYEAANNGDGTHTIRAVATIEPEWHVYSMHLPEGDGPVATIFVVSSGGEIIGEVKEIGTKLNEYDPNFMMDLSYFANTVTLEAQVKSRGDSLIRGYLEFMCCNNETCIPPDEVEFEYNPVTGELKMPGEAVDMGVTTDKPVQLQNLKIETIDLSNPESDCGVETTSSPEGAGFWMIFFLGMLGGFVALLTPCVFPMIPLTVSFFTKSSANSKQGMTNAILYGLSIFLIYIVLSLPFHLLDSIDPEILNTISTNAWLNVAFFVVFVVFAISFFGYFEITLPSSVANRADSASGLGGLLGIFFMGLTLAIVSFSCTGPILGTLLAGALSSDGGALQLTAGMGGFGLALALPFGLFAAFPGWLNSLPKSGGWLNQVKVVLGFVEVALAVKFLSNADLVEHWNILKIEPFLFIWILCALGIAAYLMGWIRFPHDSPGQKPSKVAYAVAAVAFTFAIYMMSGFRYDERAKTFTSLKVLSGIAPSAGYSFIYPSPCPLGLNCFHDYESGLAYARESNKPVLIDFTGYACVNCRKMEENVWPDQAIYDRINDDYVLISLYVDDRKELPEEERFEYVTSTGRKKKIKTFGDKWATLETETFGTNAQPHYALISPDQKLLNAPVGYTPNVDEYKAFLECGLESFKKSAP